MKTFQELFDAIKHLNAHYAIRDHGLEFVYGLAAQCPRGSSYLELGVCNGRTAALLGLLARETGSRYFGIDDFRLEGSAANVLRMFAELSIDHEHARLIVANTHSFPWTHAVDLLIIDAGHDEASVSRDIGRFLPVVKPGGFVVFDDYDEPFDRASAHWAIRHYADAACKGWADAGQVNGMRAWRRP